MLSSGSQRSFSYRPIPWDGVLDLQLLVKRHFGTLAVLQIIEIWVVCGLKIYAARCEINDDVLERPFDEVLLLHACNIQQALGFREWSTKHLAELFLDVSQRGLTANRHGAHITLELE